MDGFEIELDVDFDEPLMVSRDEPYKAPEYSGGAKCIICASVFAETVEAVLHIHKIHNIKVVGECSISSFFLELAFTSLPGRLSPHHGGCGAAAKSRLPGPGDGQC